MQLLEVPYTEDKTSTSGYFLKAREGIFSEKAFDADDVRVCFTAL